jgi:hypothetical protein
MMLALLSGAAVAQQHADPDFRPQVGTPAYRSGSGPRIGIDAAHKNWHTAAGRFAPFARLLEADGYQVQSFTTAFTLSRLSEIDVLVVANAASDTLSAESERLPTATAFTSDEVATIRRWVADGGKLLLIADHMPSGGEAQALAAAFGVLFTNGFAYSGLGNPLPEVFRRGDGLVGDHPIFRGRSAAEAIDSVATFRGQAFQVRADASPLLVFGAAAFSVLPVDAAADFAGNTPRVPSPGWFQGVALTHGAGRVAIFGEAAMFTAQVFGQQQRKLGMNHPAATQNAQFVLNIMHWLSDLLN